MSERRRLLMAQGEEDNPWEKLDYLTIVPLESNRIGIDIVPAYVEIEEYNEENDEYSYYYKSCYMEYSIDEGITWNKCKFQTDETPHLRVIINGSEGQTLKLRGHLESFLDYANDMTYSISHYTSIGFSWYYGEIALAGTPLSLLVSDMTKLSRYISGSQSIPRRCFESLFNLGSYLTKILNPKTFLPATKLADFCYNRMFTYCTSLVNAPALPATTLANYCYERMFDGCTSLVDAPALPATTLANYCYASMFYECTSLVNAPTLPATTLANYCYESMFYECTSLVNAPTLPATTLANYCYRGMFNSCTSLVNAPTLPSTTLAMGCYSYMFSMCKSLVNAPVLPSIILVSDCYTYMFNGCNQLNYIKALFTTNPDNDNIYYYTNYWVCAVASKGTFVKNKDATWNETGANGIPSGWTVITE